jgi:hypothetical protein
MARAAQGGRAGRDASGRALGCFYTARERAARRNPVGGAVVRRGVAPGRRARGERNRACSRDVLASAQRRPHRDGQRASQRSSRTDYRIGALVRRPNSRNSSRLLSGSRRLVTKRTDAKRASASSRCTRSSRTPAFCRHQTDVRRIECKEGVSEAWAVSAQSLAGGQINRGSMVQDSRSR